MHGGYYLSDVRHYFAELKNSLGSRTQHTDTQRDKRKNSNIAPDGWSLGKCVHICTPRSTLRIFPTFPILLLMLVLRQGPLTEPGAHAFSCTAWSTSPRDLPIPICLVCVAAPDIFNMGCSHWSQVLMLAWQTLYWLSRLHHSIACAELSSFLCLGLASVYWKWW